MEKIKFQTKYSKFKKVIPPKTEFDLPEQRPIITVREMLVRHTVGGINPTGHEGMYTDTEDMEGIDLEKFQMMDLAEQEKVMEEHNLTITETKRLLKEKEKQEKEMKEKEEEAEELAEQKKVSSGESTKKTDEK